MNYTARKLIAYTAAGCRQITYYSITHSHYSNPLGELLFVLRCHRFESSVSLSNSLRHTIKHYVHSSHHSHMHIYTLAGSTIGIYN